MLLTSPSSPPRHTDLQSPYHLQPSEPPLLLNTSHCEKGHLKSGKYKITVDSPYGRTYYVTAQPRESERAGYDLVVSPDDSELATWSIYAFEETKKRQPLYKIALASDVQYVCTKGAGNRLMLARESLMDDVEWGIVLMSEGIGVIYQWLERDGKYAANWAWDRDEQSPITLTTLTPTLFTFKCVNKNSE